MEEHAQADGESPLFLYVSFNAAHAPLQAEQEWLRKCSHIPHHWRRQGRYSALVHDPDLIGSLIGSLKLGNVWGFLQLIFGPGWPAEQKSKHCLI